MNVRADALGPSRQRLMNRNSLDRPSELEASRSRELRFGLVEVLIVGHAVWLAFGVGEDWGSVREVLRGALEPVST